MKNFKSRFTIQWLKAAGMRALHTFLQTALGCLTVGTVITDINWLYILEVAGTAALVSLAKSFIANVPELSKYDDELVESDDILELNEPEGPEIEPVDD